MVLPERSKYRRSALLALTLMLAGAAPAAPAAIADDYDLGVREHVFDNGLRLLVIERPGDPRVACKIFTDMGGLNETPGQAGAAHFLEHLMFKGTETLGTTDWAAESEIVAQVDEAEAELIAALDAARNETAERGVFHDYRHAETTPRIEAARSRIAELESMAAPYRDNGPMMRWYQAFGGTGLTATTEQEYMKFDINLPAERVDLFLRVEADRMTNTVFREFDQERMILVEQRLGDLNRASTPYTERMAAVSGESSPVFWPEGHYPDDFMQYSRAYQRQLYERYFVVNNTTLVFIGGVTLEQMIPRVETYFGWMPRQPEPPRSEATEPVPMAERRLIYRNDELAPRVELRHGIPGVGHPDRAAFDVLALVAVPAIERSLAAAGLTGSVGANTRVIHTSRFGVPATLNIEVLASSADLEAVERAMLAAIDGLARGEIDDAELRAAQKTLRTQWYRTVADADALAFEIGHFQTMDRWQTLQAHLQQRDATDVQQLARLAGRYFIPDNRVVGIVRPRDQEQGQ
jgi:predicted Zn-dependent peptidase